MFLRVVEILHRLNVLTTDFNFIFVLREFESVRNQIEQNLLIPLLVRVYNIEVLHLAGKVQKVGSD